MGGKSIDTQRTHTQHTHTARASLSLSLCALRVAEILISIVVLSAAPLVVTYLDLFFGFFTLLGGEVTRCTLLLYLCAGEKAG